MSTDSGVRIGARFRVPGGYRRSILLAMVLLWCGGHVAVAATSTDSPPASERPLTTYERFLPYGVAGDPSIQHFLGYMFFYGEGVEQNFDDALLWFRAAAEEGDHRAQRNLGLMYARAVDVIPARFYDPVAANLWLSLAAANPASPEYSPRAASAHDRFLPASDGSTRVSAGVSRDGESLYQASCAGCHGFDGVGAYPAVPSFAAGEGYSGAGNADGPFHEWVESVSTSPGLDPASRQRILNYVRQQLHIRPTVTTESGPDGFSPTGKLAQAEEIYLRFCGGCHGFNGIAWYVNSPSFALGERLHKGDAELAHSIEQGRGAMPSWEYLLKPEQIDLLVRYIRSLAPRYERGIVSDLRRPELFLRFRPGGETGPNWTADDLR